MKRLMTWPGPAAAAALAAGLTIGLGGILSRAEPRPAAPPADGEAVATFRFRVQDGFGGKSGLAWQPVRHDPTHVSFTKHPGKLTITTQCGTIHADEQAREEPKAKNLYLLPNPLAENTSFVLTTCLEDFKPTERYQQAGLLCYDDDDNYVKWVYEFSYVNGGTQAFGLIRETKAATQHHIVPVEGDLPRVWLRLTRRGKEYEYATSTDGKKFTVHGQKEWKGVPRMLGLVAKNGGPQGVPEIDACFDSFELQAPPPARDAE